MMNEKLEVLRESITGFTPLTKEQIQLDSDLSGDLCLDSADRVELVLDLEEYFNIRLPDEEYSYCETIKDIINLIDSKQQKQEAKI